MKNKIYLAARYSRREELCIYRDQLQSRGFVVTSRWLNGDHEPCASDTTIHGLSSASARFAQEDWDDLTAADICISFTEPEKTTATRGGRHVEFGAALAMHKCCIVVGHRENVFHHLDKRVFFYENWDSLFYGWRPYPRHSLECAPQSAKSATAGKWIELKTGCELPEKGKPVPVIRENDYAFLSLEYGVWYDGKTSTNKRVTHWFDLPAGPVPPKPDPCDEGWKKFLCDVEGTSEERHAYQVGFADGAKWKEAAK